MILRHCNTIKKCLLEDQEEDEGTSISTARKQYSHQGCGAFQPNFKREGLKIRLEFEEDQEQEFYNDRKRDFPAEDALKVLKNISDNDYLILGFDPARSPAK